MNSWPRTCSQGEVNRAEETDNGTIEKKHRKGLWMK